MALALAACADEAATGFDGAVEREQPETTSTSSPSAVEDDVEVATTRGNVQPSSTAPLSDPVVGTSSVDGEQSSAEFFEGSILPDSLGILDASREEVEMAIAPLDGTIDIAEERVSLYQVRFPVDSIDELLEVRESLEADGFNVALIPTTSFEEG